MTEPNLPSSDVLERVEQALSGGQATAYVEGLPDKAYQAVRWSIYGLLATNEIAVVAEAGPLRIGICAPSRLHFPRMVDRIFGMDIADAQLAEELAEEIWGRNGRALIDATGGSPK